MQYLRLSLHPCGVGFHANVITQSQKWLVRTFTLPKMNKTYESFSCVNMNLNVHFVRRFIGKKLNRRSITTLVPYYAIVMMGVTNSEPIPRFPS